MELDFQFVEFIETTGFTALLEEYFPDENDYRRLQIALQTTPTVGRVIPGCGGMRKVRWHDPRRGKGKRGGLRIIYLWIPDENTIVLFDIYDKGEADDLAPHVRAGLSRAVEAAKQSVRIINGRKRNA